MSVFTDIDPSYWTASNDLAFAIRDRYPVSTGHTLVITKREVPTWFEATPEEQRAVMALVDEVKQALDREFTPAGYNVGFNAGEAAGQTVMHLHVHVIPRYAGDMDDPRGGVRHVIPGKGNYLAAAEPLATGGDADPFLRHLAPHLKSAQRIDILAAFVQQSGVDRLLPFLREALARGAAVRVLTGHYNEGTEGSSVYRSESNVATTACTLALLLLAVKAAKLAGLHPKSWRFETHTTNPERYLCCLRGDTSDLALATVSKKNVSGSPDRRFRDMAELGAQAHGEPPSTPRKDGADIGTCRLRGRATCGRTRV
jgi:diadenosine tetraphosphate (Ap4A) HIT family hydrolase